jgi:hypothetical protein
MKGLKRRYERRSMDRGYAPSVKKGDRVEVGGACRRFGYRRAKRRRVMRGRVAKQAKEAKEVTYE